MKNKNKNKKSIIYVHVQKREDSLSKLLLSYSINSENNSVEVVTWPRFLEDGEVLHYNTVLSLNHAYLKLKNEAEGHFSNFKFIFEEGNKVEGSFNMPRGETKHFISLTKWEQSEFYNVIRLTPEKLQIIKSENQPTE